MIRSGTADVTTAGAREPGSGGGALGLLRANHAFRNLWSGSTISLLGAEISLVALPLLAVLSLGATAFEMGVLTAAGTLPNLLLSIAFGTWVDRRGRRRQLMIAADLIGAVLLAAVPVAWWLGQLTLGLLYVIAFLVGAVGVLSNVAFSVMLAASVPRDRIVQANQVVHGSMALTSVAGNGAGGVLVQLIGAPATLLSEAIGYLGSAYFLGRMKVTEPPPAAEAGQRHWLAGMRMIRRTPVIRASLATIATINLFTFAFYALFVLYATRELHVRPALLGALLASAAVGAMLGAWLVGPLTRRAGIGWAFIAGSFLFPGALILVPAAAGPRPLVIAVLFAAMLGTGLGVMVQDVSANSISLAIVPDAIRSRVTGAYMTVNYGARPVGAMLGGGLAAAIGLRGALWAVTIAATLGVGFLLASPVRTLRDLPEQADAGGDHPTGASGDQSTGAGSAT